ncbi:iron-containing alcohol dehydrogenase [Desulfatibacillum aliphaticivorans]|uniref:iron-containing alcohol dehydrogenase n=1 Tax=Desulfatibacillum aliphaticivorans TaxID=218208 RepID=UPI00041566A2|nr:iron-containing alcohol dehydrogenase [Desulfatibacillum aliphaticivorans]
MRNFDYHNPTKVVFGKGTISRLKNLVPPRGKIMLVTGGESIRKNGVHDQVMDSLKKREVVEFSGIAPNPEYDVLMQAVDMVKKEEPSFLLAVGGGSIMDGTKFIAAASKYTAGDPWEICSKLAKVTDALPLGVVVTLPATGSETNNIGVVSRKAEEKKIVFHADKLFPRFAVMDPEVTYSLPDNQVRNGVVDAFIHVLEQYLTYPVQAPLQDRQAEAVLLTLLEVGPKTLAKKQDYDARAGFMWCANQALNGLLKCGVPTDFATHRIGHELTVHYGLAHGEAIAVVLCWLLRHQRENKQDKLLQYARRIWMIEDKDEELAVNRAIAETECFFNEMGMPTRLTDYGIDPAEAAETVRKGLERDQAKLGERGRIGPAEAADIVRASV